ncbi:unnamed protein product [Owenia fusiformis]|uniref:Uncharacterized protein n=1 Tax=Owenia fusiformis TaxID=6347 RepID=A0A8J1XVL0_OWEFU|nr:unnamed protein product [Owenia fusiformis]
MTTIKTIRTVTSKKSTMNFIKNVGTAISSAVTSSGLEMPRYEHLNKPADPKEIIPYEERHYPESKWASTTIKAMKYEDATREGFWRLFKYIQGNNETKTTIPMTAPVRTKIVPGAGPNCESTFTISFYVGDDFVENTPKPSNPDVFIETTPEMTLFSRQFGGFAKEEQWIEEAKNLSESINGKEKFETGYYYTNGYDSPFKLFSRRNEVWFVKTPKDE